MLRRFLHPCRVGNYPWFVTFNFLQTKWPKAKEGDTKGKLVRNALIGARRRSRRDARSKRSDGSARACCRTCPLREE